MAVQKRDRLGIVHPPFMIGVALLLELIQAFVNIFHFIPAIGNVLAIVSGWLVTMIGFLIFFLWFLLLGIPLFSFNPSKALVYGGALVIESIPFISVLPVLAFAVAVIIVIVKREDAVYNKKMKKQIKRQKAFA